jgi:DNA-directed RNA polymerase specialized sigma24 family protein
LTPFDDPQLNTRAAEKPEELTAPRPSQSKWFPTPQSFEKLLAAFDSDDEEAGKKYEHARVKLLRYFEQKGIYDADRYVDITLDRVMRRLDEGERVINTMAFIYGVASYVRMEAWNEQKQLREREVEIKKDSEQRQHDDIGHESPRQICLDQCLNELPIETRILILDYYSAEQSAKIKLRRQMAHSLGIEMNALRIRAHRIRINLETCVQKCVSQLG